MRAAHQRVADQAQCNGDALALLCGGASTTYAELAVMAERHAAGLAEALRRVGNPGAGARIGLAVARSVELVSLVLATHRCGAAFVPLDPRLPTDRLAYMAADAGVSLVVVEGDERPAWLPEQIPIVSVDELDALHALHALHGDDAPSALRRLEILENDLAYVIYTSGSTGRPKGVRISHKNLSLICDAWSSVVHVRERAVFLFHSTLAFDASLTEFLWPLTQGHTVVVVPDDVRAGFGESFGTRIERHGVTHVQCTPTRAVLLLADPDDRRSLRRLQQVLLGGEALPPALVHQLKGAGVEQVTNIYGPTECSIWSFAHDVESTDGATVPIGRPLPGVKALIVDEHFTTVDDGIEGELIIAGSFVGGGYHERPEITAEKFSTRMVDGQPVPTYRTGDRVIRRADGVHVFLGRIDTQVKLRGHRIELGEIESALIEQPSIAQAVATVVGHGLGDDRLVAYVIARRNMAFDEVGVRRALGQRMSAVMVPSLYVVLEEFPLTPSGKVDRRALPEPQPYALIDDVAPALAGSVIDRIVADFSQVFGRPVRPDDDFFALGGHSLLAVQLLTRIGERKGIDLPLTVLLDAPTPRLLAERAANPGGFSNTSSLVRFGRSSATQKLYLIHGAGGNVIGFRELALLLVDDVDVIGVQAAGVEPGQQPDRSMAAMVARYATAILADDPVGPYWIGGYSDGGLISLHLAQEIRRRELTVTGLVILDSFVAEPMPATRLGRLGNVWRNSGDRGGRSVGPWARASWRAWRARSGYLDANAEVARELGYAMVDAVVDQAVLGAGDPGPIPAPALVFRSTDTTPTFWFDYSLVERRPAQVRRVWVPGGHSTVFTGANAHLVADEIRQAKPL